MMMMNMISVISVRLMDKIRRAAGLEGELITMISMMISVISVVSVIERQ